eukprot:maker-scaffold51_size454968-snap-gene-0.3 protein:Tk05760 transcript:maker-scaffold51_size454968-snap-gene-0.3-mRNA-1 annotation:"hypothetical protein DAPPUDRAFT_305568"
MPSRFWQVRSNWEESDSHVQFKNIVHTINMSNILALIVVTSAAVFALPVVEESGLNEVIEERKYIADLPWACVTKGGDVTRRNMFWSLFRFIDGQNDAGMKISMSSPVSDPKDSGTEYVEPDYQVVRTLANGEIEERKYIADLPWACVTKGGDVTRRNMFWSLFRFIDGQNDAGMKISMSSPVRSTRNADESEDRKMCFFLGQKFQDTQPPTPNDSSVTIERTPEMTVYTRRVGGYMRGNAWDEEFDALNTLLKTNNVDDMETSYYYRNGYDSPWKLTNRRNEVWIV